MNSKDKKIVDQLYDPAHGEWSSDGKGHAFKPKPSFFGNVEPMDLVEFFNQYAPKGAYLNMGDYE